MLMNFVIINLDQNVEDKADTWKNCPCSSLFISEGRSTKYIGVKIPSSIVNVPLWLVISVDTYPGQQT